MKGPFKPL